MSELTVKVKLFIIELISCFLTMRAYGGCFDMLKMFRATRLGRSFVLVKKETEIAGTCLIGTSSTNEHMRNRLVHLLGLFDMLKHHTGTMCHPVFMR